jgi:hypothetical protein
MCIVVPIKQVPEIRAVRMDERMGTMIRDGIEVIAFSIPQPTTPL